MASCIKIHEKEMPKKRKTFDHNVGPDRLIVRTLPDELAIWKVGIISDTHGKLPNHAVLSQLFEGVREIWHAGDIAGRDGSFESASAVLNDLNKIAPVKHIVRGNVDKFCGGLVGFRGYDARQTRGEMSNRFPEVRSSCVN